MMIKTNDKQIAELRHDKRMAIYGFVICLITGMIIGTIDSWLGCILLLLGTFSLIETMADYIRYIKKRQDAMIRIFCDNLKGFEDDLNNPCYWMEGDDADPDEYVPSGDHDPEDPSIK